MTETPKATHTEFSARLQVLPLTGDSYVLIFDQHEGPALPPDQAKRIRDDTGAKAVLFFRGIIDIGC
jgi:hypothetical protein